MASRRSDITLCRPELLLTKLWRRRMVVEQIRNCCIDRNRGDKRDRTLPLYSNNRFIWISVLVTLLSTPVMAATFVVNSTGDQADISTGDGVCSTNAGTYTLRAAIQQANASASTVSSRTVFSIVTDGIRSRAPMRKYSTCLWQRSAAQNSAKDLDSVIAGLSSRRC